MNTRQVLFPKTRIVLAVIWSSCSICFSQGLVDFHNYDPRGVDSPIYDVDGTTPLAGPAFLAGLYAATPGNSLQPVGVPVGFFVGDPGYFGGAYFAVPGVEWGDMAVVQVVAWRASDGPTFAAANHPGGHVGQSSIFIIGPLGNPGPPGNPLPAALIGLQSFALYVVVPEPSALALGLLGGSALFLYRRARTVRRRFSTQRRFP